MIEAFRVVVARAGISVIILPDSAQSYQSLSFTFLALRPQKHEILYNNPKLKNHDSHQIRTSLHVLSYAVWP